MSLLAREIIAWTLLIAISASATVANALDITAEIAALRTRHVAAQYGVD
jgi:hypothetical protein